MTDLTVLDVPDQQRFEALTPDGKLAGAAFYELNGPVITFTHTEVSPEFEGKGVGGSLVRAALDDLAARGLLVQPQCPFVRGWIERHPDYAELLVST